MWSYHPMSSGNSVTSKPERSDRGVSFAGETEEFVCAHDDNAWSLRSIGSDDDEGNDLFRKDDDADVFEAPAGSVDNDLETGIFPKASPRLPPRGSVVQRSSGLRTSFVTDLSTGKVFEAKAITAHVGTVLLERPPRTQFMSLSRL